MARNRDDVLAIVVMIAHADVANDGTQYDKKMIIAQARQWFDVAEAILDEADRRYPAQPE